VGFADEKYRLGSHAACNMTVVASSGLSILALRIIIRIAVAHGIPQMRLIWMFSLLNPSSLKGNARSGNPAAKAA
jgi:hypothetical protein